MESVMPSYIKTPPFDPSLTEGKVVKWKIEVGAQVASANQDVADVQAEKSKEAMKAKKKNTKPAQETKPASAPEPGELAVILVAEGQKVKIGDSIGIIALRSENPEKIKKEHTADLERALTHARELFTYHAGQRHFSINFFTTALALTTGGVATALGKTTLDTGETAALLGLGSATVILLSWSFRRLDKRNANLVECDEAALKSAEQELAVKMGSRAYETVRHSDDYKGPKYASIMPWLFWWFISLGIVGLVYSIHLFVSPAHAPVVPTTPPPNQGTP
jgi:pyruvate/2-oxoglutarate dehydrogenase complex dihydrolipoamide acyltransferase (E2) component